MQLSGEFSLLDISPMKLRLHSHLSRQRIREAEVSVVGRLDFTVEASSACTCTVRFVAAPFIVVIDSSFNVCLHCGLVNDFFE